MAIIYDLFTKTVLATNPSYESKTEIETVKIIKADSNVKFEKLKLAVFEVNTKVNFDKQVTKLVK